MKIQGENIAQHMLSGIFHIMWIKFHETEIEYSKCKKNQNEVYHLAGGQQCISAK